MPDSLMKLFNKLLLPALLLVFIVPICASAAEGGGRSGADASLTKINYIITNIQGDDNQYLQVEITLKLAHPELAKKVQTYMPIIRHKLILLLSSKNDDQLRPPEAKIKLVKETKNIINKVLALNSKDGVKDVFFTSFIIQ